MDKFLHDLEQANLISDVDNANNVHEAYSKFHNKLMKIVDTHIPEKKRKTVHKPAPFMNKHLKSAIYNKQMMHNKYIQVRSRQNWDNYRQQRNLVTKLKRKSIRNYFIERCTGGPKQKDFWPTIKPFLTNKGSHFDNNIVLCNNDDIINDQSEVAEIFNNYFVNVAKDIGSDSCEVNENHPSIKTIRENCSVENTLFFKEINDDFVEKQINKISVNKATGFDGISMKILKMSKPVIVKPITKLINMSIKTSEFPDTLKEAQVIPLHKKNSQLEAGNYRPVSILPAVSKFFERAIYQQLIDYFGKIFHPSLSAFRPGYGCNTALLKIIEDWKKAVDKNLYVAAILMDLSKAFDCLPHNLLLLKLKAYGLSKEALDLIDNYLSNRKQCVKVGAYFTTWQNIYKGVPQGSILGPVFFNIFLNDIFHFVKENQLYNYADDNTLSHSGPDLNGLVKSLENESTILIDWFADNKMKANPDKFQAIAIGNKTKSGEIKFILDGNEISCDNEVKLLGVTIDYQLKFKTHISDICKKASRQLNVLKRIGKHLSKLGSLTIYYSFIMSNFNYCPVVWHFCGEGNTKKMEKVQERALRFIYEDFNSNYETLLLKSGLPTLKIRRLRMMAIETFKILHKESPVYLHDIIKFKTVSYSFRKQQTVEVPQVKTTHFGLNSFRYAGATLWNELPDSIRSQTNLHQFKSMINNWNGNSCKCGSCRS